MQSFCLDRTIHLTREAFNDKSLIPGSIDINGNKFHFRHSKMELPIEHLGLAILCYEQARDSFYTTVFNKDGERRIIFEQPPEWTHISDFLKNFSNDSLCWYKNEHNEPLQLPQKPDGTIEKPDLSKSYKYFDINESNEITSDENAYRVGAVTQAVHSAILLYQAELVSNGVVTTLEELAEVVDSEKAALNANLESLASRQIQTVENEPNE